MVTLYLAIEKNRFEEKLSYKIEVEEKLREKLIPRFLIQPLVENSIKHGISKITEQGLIVIKVFEIKNEIFIKIFDNGPGFPDGLLTGNGLQNTYDKLSLIYKKPYEIKLVNKPEKYIQIVLKE
jgi:LytS/YehU family sensor histidine kinase